MTVRKKSFTTTIHTTIKSWIDQLFAYSKTVHRALVQQPRRLVNSSDPHRSVWEMFRSFFVRTPPTLLLFIGSLMFLVYALISTQIGGSTQSIAIHNSSDVGEQNMATTNEPIQEELAQETTIITNDSPDTINHIYTMYTAIHDGNYVVQDYFDTYMQTSNLVTMYFTSKKLSTLQAAIDGKIRVVDAEEFATDRNDRIGVRYTLNYKLSNNNTLFTETRSAILRPQSGGWRIGTIRCESRGCSSNPIFNPDKYGIR